MGHKPLEFRAGTPKVPALAEQVPVSLTEEKCKMQSLGLVLHNARVPDLGRRKRQRSFKYILQLAYRPVHCTCIYVDSLSGRKCVCVWGGRGVTSLSLNVCTILANRN